MAQGLLCRGAMRSSLWLAAAMAVGCGSEAVSENDGPDEEGVTLEGWAEHWASQPGGAAGKADGFGLSAAPRGLVANGGRQNGGRQNGGRQNGGRQNGGRQNGAEDAMQGANLATLKLLRSPPAAGLNPSVTAPSDPVSGVHLDRGILTNAVWRRAGSRTGAGYKGALIDGSMGDGTAVKLYIEDVQQPVAADVPQLDVANPDVLYYVVKVQWKELVEPDPDLDVEDPFCEPDLGARRPCRRPRPRPLPPHVVTHWSYACGTYDVTDPQTSATHRFPVPAIAVPGQWSFDKGYAGAGSKLIDSSSADYTRKITFACMNGAIGKCAAWGYRPWKRQGTQTLELPHEACVRMVRADYCGDGQEHTRDGIYIDVWDNVGVMTQLPYSMDPNVYGAPAPLGVPFGLEAEWTPNGARCISQILMPRTSDEAGLVPGQNLILQHYLEDATLRPYCAYKWPTQVPHAGLRPGEVDHYQWSQDGCFGTTMGGGQGVVTDFDGQNLAPNPRDRVYMRNSSVCIDDRNMPSHHQNPMKTSSQWAGYCLPGI